MSRVIYLPLEEMPARYSGMMNGALAPYVDVVLYPKGFESVEIKHGEFLDVSRTIEFKAAQMRMVAEMFSAGEVRDGDGFLLADIFHPGMEGIRYMAELLGIKVRIGGFNYAGRADETDFVQRLGLWADESERGYHYAADIIFVGSEFHRSRVLDKFMLSLKKVKATGYVWDTSYVTSRMATGVGQDPMSVIWPHRPCEEKGWGEFCTIASACPHHTFIVTSCGPERTLPTTPPPNVRYLPGLTKEEYYWQLQRAWLFLSTAQQETFGYAMHEAIVCDCAILAPNRACYPEFLPASRIYNNTAEAIERIQSGHVYGSQDEFMLAKWHDNAKTIVNLLMGVAQ